jgi:hypothetical protein
MLLVSTTYKMFSNILLWRLTPYVDEVIGDHQCGFRRNRSTADQILHSLDTREKLEYIQTVCQSFIDFKLVRYLVVGLKASQVLRRSNPEDTRRRENLKSHLVSRVKGRTQTEGVWKQGA